MAEIQNIIFDMDGVLLDSERGIRNAYVRMFAEHGVQAKQEDFIPYTGMGDKEFMEGAAAQYGLKYHPSMTDRAYAIYGETAGEFVVVYDGIAELIADLKARGYGCAVASAAADVKVRVNLRCIGLTAADFDAVVTGSQVERNKPNPDIFLKAASLIGAAPDSCLVVEDALAGCQAALAAGMRCVGVTSTFTDEQLLQAGASFTIPETRLLPSLLDQFA